MSLTIYKNLLQLSRDTGALLLFMHTSFFGIEGIKRLALASSSDFAVSAPI